MGLQLNMPICQRCVLSGGCWADGGGGGNNGCGDSGGGGDVCSGHGISWDDPFFERHSGRTDGLTGRWTNGQTLL